MRARVAVLTALVAVAAVLEGRAQEPQQIVAVGAAGSDEQERLGLRFEEQIVVTAGRTEQKLSDLAVHATVVTAEDVRRSPAQNVGDLLMEVPSFSMQRSATTRVATPATTPAALRSLGGGTASRALVLVDGVPLNDPFFGWVPWSLVSRTSVERIEVVPAGGGGAWGNHALGGVIHILTRRPERTSVELDTRFGSLDTRDLDLGGSYVRGPVSFSPRVSYFETGGYVQLGEEFRGPVDTKSASDNYLLDGRLEYAPAPGSRWTLQGSYLDDDRTTGTPLNLDHADIRALRGGAHLSTAGGGLVRLHAFGQWRGAWSTRGSVNSDRTSVTPSRNQFDIPSSAFGAGVSWSRPLSPRHSLSAGADVQRTEGEVHDDSRYSAGRYAQRNVTGGKQLVLGFYGQDTALLGSRWRVATGGRLDFWRTWDGLDFAQNLASGAALRDVRLPDRSQWVFSPNLGLRFSVSDRLGLRGSVYRTFRAPTPSELYRSTQTGARNFNEANENLELERIRIGVESGLDYAVARAFSARVTGFWNEFENAITDVTVGSAGRTAAEIPPCGLVPAGGSCRQKQNLERVRNRGAELEIQIHPWRQARLAASYAYASSTVTRAPNQPQLVGKTLRRVPEHQLSVRAEYANPKVLTASLRGRYLGGRYQDDRNVFFIDDSLVLDLSLSRRVSKSFEIYAIAENLLDEAFEVDAESDGIEYGHPRILHLGLRYRWQGRESDPRGR